jgi:ribosome biogenesis ATPase
MTSDTPSLLLSNATNNNKSSTMQQQQRKRNANAVLEELLDKHREYRRKDVNRVRRGVEVALAHLGGKNGVGTRGTASSSNGGGGRKGWAAAVVRVGGGSNIDHDENGGGGKSGGNDDDDGDDIYNRDDSDGDDASHDDPACDRDPSDIRDDDDDYNDDDDIMEDADATTRSTFRNKRRHRDVDLANHDAMSPSRHSAATYDDDASMLMSSTAPCTPSSPPHVSQTIHSSGMLNAGLRDRYKNAREEEERRGGRRTGRTGDRGGGDEDAVASATANTNTTTAVAGTGTNDPIGTAKSTPVVASRKKKRNVVATRRAPSRSSSSMRDDDGGGAYHPVPNAVSAPLPPSPRPTERYSDLGGISPLLTQLRELIEYPLSRPELFLHLGVEPPRGVLLRGPPGCGKTHLARAIAGELDVGYYQVSAPELVGGVSGESEMRVRNLFESASDNAPAIIFIDEIDSIAPKRGEGSGGGGGGRGMEKRIVAQLLTSMDSIHPKNTRNGCAVLVLGATNRPDAMDPALRRAGRFDREIVLGAPDEKAREGILRAMTRDMRVSSDLNYKALARKTPGYVGADVRSLLKEAAVIAINRIFRTELLGCGGGTTQEGTDDGDTHRDEARGDDNGSDKVNIGARNDVRSIVPLTPEQLQPLYVTMSDFLSAIPHVQPSSKREGFATVPDVSWSDIGALANIREELTLSVLEPISHPERFEALGLPLPAGVLLYGPPGCGKTLLAKAIAKESGANFISVKGPELLDKYVGESERAVRVVFERARSSSPCIIFFDELDSLCPKRGSDGGSGGGGVSERVVNQLLTEMDGLDSRRSVFVIAATNRPELIDPAMLRPGRLDKLLYVPLPSSDERYSILCALSKKVKLAADVDLRAIAHNPNANGFSGADCAALLREAGLAVLRDGVLRRTDPNSGHGEEDESRVVTEAEPPLQITAHHFRYAFEHVLPSVSTKDQARYDKLRDRMARARTRPTSAGGGNGDASDVETAPERNESL